VGLLEGARGSAVSVGTALRRAAVPRLSRTATQRLQGWLLIAPWLLGFIVLQLGAYVAALVISFSDWNLRTATFNFVGFTNYLVAFSDDLVGRSLLNTLVYTVFHVPGVIVLAFVVAGLLNIKVKGLPVFRTMFYLPSITAGAGMAIIWIWLLNPNGIINAALGLVGIKGPNWLANPNTALPALIFMGYWGIGGTMVLFLAGLQGIPQHLYDALKVDGGGWRAQVRHITVPMMTPYFFLAFVTGVIGSFQVFTQALLTTEGGPDNATLFVFLYIYQMGWQSLRMGYASAIAWLLFLVILIFTLIQFVAARRWVYYEYQGSQ